MALKIPGLKLFSATDTKARIFILVTAVLAFGFLIYVAVSFLGGTETTTGATQVASAPGGLQTVPGGQLSPEFYRAVVQANAQASEQAKISGGSAVPMMVNTPNMQQQGFSQQGNCTVLCSDEAVDVTNDINDLVRQGALSQDDANKLIELTKNNVSPDEYAAALNELVKQGKLTPEQARKLLERYKKQHKGLLTAASGQVMDGLIKSGQISIDDANRLLALQKSDVSAADYSAELNRMAKDGKISSTLVPQLLGQYVQQRAGEGIKKGEFELKQMAKTGQITADVAQALATLQKNNAPLDQYKAELDRLVAAGKMTPAVAAKIMEEYAAQRAEQGAIGNLNALQNQAETQAVTQLSDLLKAGKLSTETANALFAMQQKRVSPEEYQAALNQLVQAKKLSAEDAQKLADTYKRLAELRAAAQKLASLQGNNASATDYTNELKRQVQAGTITPEMAAALLQEYQGVITTGVAPSIDTNIPGTQNFAALQQRLQQQQTEVAPVVATEQFSQAEMAAQAEAERARAERIQQLATAMAGQAQTLIAAWKPVPMEHKAGAESEKKTTTTTASGSSQGATTGTTSTTTTTTGKPFVKAGYIAFAVLDTAVDSDYPDTPVMATIIQGPLKGVKLLGKMSMPSGKDKLSLTFNMMDKEDWAKTKTINAFAIDPDTARTVMASDVDYHYLMRYGSMMGAAFLTGYANAISNAGSVQTTGIFGTSTTTQQLSPGNKIAVGLGQVGTALSTAVNSYVNTPPTVKVNSGVGLGILFMADVTE